MKNTNFVVVNLHGPFKTCFSGTHWYCVVPCMVIVLWPMFLKSNSSRLHCIILNVERQRLCLTQTINLIKVLNAIYGVEGHFILFLEVKRFSLPKLSRSLLEASEDKRNVLPVKWTKIRKNQSNLKFILVGKEMSAEV